MRTDRVTIWLVRVLMVAPAVVRFGFFEPGRTPIQVVDVFVGLGLQRTRLFAMGIALWPWSRRSSRRLPSWHVALLVAACIVVPDLHVFPFHRATPLDPARWPFTIGFAVLLLVSCLAACGPDRRFPGPRAGRPGDHPARGDLVWSLPGAPGTGLRPGARPAGPRRPRLAAAPRGAGRRVAQAGPGPGKPQVENAVPVSVGGPS
ncbi:hypothetical protein [Amycolatopsis sp. NPDC051903]|uniref:hypothetical protein n=1 Tax=Amycolatopsis sp. NPDC051903 TaxID=3363936 RepID=UPI0037A0B531